MNNLRISTANNQFTFRDIGQLVGFEYPESRSAIEYISGDMSAVFVSNKPGERRLSWQAVLSESERQQLGAVLTPDGLKLLRFEVCGVEYRTEIVITKVVSPYKHNRQVYLIEAVAPDWRLYSQTEYTISTGQTILKDGFALPAILPISFELSLDSSSYKVINNLGNETTEPIIKVYGEGSSFYVKNITTDQEFTITETLAVGEYITIDSRARTVIENGTTSIYSLFSGSFIRLAPGENRLQFIVLDSGANTLMETTYRDAYIGI